MGVTIFRPDLAKVTRIVGGFLENDDIKCIGLNKLAEKRFIITALLPIVLLHLILRVIPIP